MFIQRDPIGLLGGINVFQYAPNPIHWIDVLGLSNHQKVFWDKVGWNDYKEYQVHHIIPQALFNQKKYPSAAKILSCHGIDQDDFSNLIGLPKYSNSHPRKTEKHFGNVEHRSNHQGYSNAVSDAIIGIGKIKNCTVQLSKIKALQNILRTELRRGNIYLMDGSKVKWSSLLRAKGF